jgi:hypothetical protein
MPKINEQQFCSKDCYLSSIRQKRIKTVCNWCGKVIEVRESHYIKYKSHHCCNQHRAFSSIKNRGAEIKQVGKELEKISWNQSIAYLIGLIATDGTLRKSRNQIKITSSDKDFLIIVTEIIFGITGRIQNVLYEEVKFKGKKYNSYSIHFTSDPFYKFCLNIGLTPNKTFTITSLNVPDDYFSSFLRGVIDGDGNYSFSNKNKCEIKTRIYSGSIKFLEWINESCKRIYKIGGANIYYESNELGRKCVLFFCKVYENLLILESIYNNANYYYPKKYEKVMHVVENISEYKKRYLHTCLELKICDNPDCNNSFIKTHYKQKYCCQECRQDYSYIRRK